MSCYPRCGAAHEHLAHDGLFPLGDCFWERQPDPALRAEMEKGSGPQKFTDLPTLVDNVVADGWTPVFGHVSTQTERSASSFSSCAGPTVAAPRDRGLD